MNPIHFHFCVNFHKENKPITPAEAIYRSIIEKPVEEEKRPYEPGVHYKSEPKKCSIVWNYNSCSIVLEDQPNNESYIKRTIEILEDINRVVPIIRSNSRQLIMFWILPVEKYDFKSLERKYRDHFIKSRPIFEDTFDSSVIIEAKIGKLILHHQSGAMGIKQLKEKYRVFKIKEGFPKLFMFLMTVINDNNEVKYSRNNMFTLLTDSCNIFKSHADDFEKEMEGIL